MKLPGGGPSVRPFAFYTKAPPQYDRRPVQTGISIPQAVLLFADETAEWNVAGLRQLDRTLLALNDFFRRVKVSKPIPVLIKGLAGAVQTQSLAYLKLTSELDDLRVSEVMALRTRIVLGRDALPRAFESEAALKLLPLLIVDGADLPTEWGSESNQLHTAEHNGPERDWTYLNGVADIPLAAKKLFRRTGKSQDGIVSRFLNRPLSRGLSRLLVQLPFSPNQWTLLFMLLPLVGAVFVLRGDYLGFAMGAVFFQLHSALDGCDGEVARVKYLETKSGKKLDAVCDRVSTLLFALSLGIGLYRQHASANGAAWLYVVEGISAALLLGAAETWLTRGALDDETESADDLFRSYVTENRQTFNEGDQLKLWVIRHSGMLSVGEGLARFFGELTKRDVFNFVFMLLALCGRAQWVLHILAVCACAIVAFAVKEMLSPTADANSPA